MRVVDAEFDSWVVAQGARGPRVRFDAIGEAWRIYQEHFTTWLAVMIVAYAFFFVVLWTVSLIGGVRLAPGPGFFRPALHPREQFVPTVLSSMVFGLFLGGMFRIACVQVRGGVALGREGFGVLDVLPALLLGSLLYGLIVALGFMLLVVPGLIAAGVLMFALPLIVDGRLSATEALEQSWHALKGEWLTATLFHLVVWVLAGCGVLCCGFGVLITGPLYCLSIAVLYRDCFPTQADSGMKPAPPFPEI